MNEKLMKRIEAVTKSLVKDVAHGPFESGTELLAVIELATGTVQFHLTLTRDELLFIDPDAPTGCADDLTVNIHDFC